MSSAMQRSHVKPALLGSQLEIGLLHTHRDAGHSMGSGSACLLGTIPGLPAGGVVQPSAQSPGTGQPGPCPPSLAAAAAPAVAAVLSAAAAASEGAAAGAVVSAAAVVHAAAAAAAAAAWQGACSLQAAAPCPPAACALRLSAGPAAELLQSPAGGNGRCFGPAACHCHQGQRTGGLQPSRMHSSAAARSAPTAASSGPEQLPRGLTTGWARPGEGQLAREPASGEETPGEESRCSASSPEDSESGTTKGACGEAGRAALLTVDCLRARRRGSFGPWEVSPDTPEAWLPRAGCLAGARFGSCAKTALCLVAAGCSGCSACSCRSSGAARLRPLRLQGQAGALLGGDQHREQPNARVRFQNNRSPLGGRTRISAAASARGGRRATSWAGVKADASQGCVIMASRAGASCICRL